MHRQPMGVVVLVGWLSVVVVGCQTARPPEASTSASVPPSEVVRPAEPQPKAVVVSSAPQEPAVEPVSAVEPSSAAPTAQVQQPSPQGPEGWPFWTHAIGSCFPDRLVYSAYLKWYAPQMWGLRRMMRPGDPKPTLGLAHPKRGPEPGTEEFERVRNNWLEAWKPQEGQTYASHVMDCAFRFPWPPESEELSRPIPYMVYLPSDYLEHPGRRRPLLVLFPGGRGNRTRWFLIPLDYRFGEKGSGGVKMRWRMDDWADRHPGAPTPLVVSINGPGVFGRGNDVQFLSTILPEHILSTFLPHQTLENTPYGLETISSSGGIGVRALYAHPTQINVLGLNCLACVRAGLIPDTHLGPREERMAITRLLAERKRQGVLDVRFSIGDADAYLGCNRALYNEFLEVGFWERQTEPEFIDCGPKSRRWTRKQRCVRAWPGFFLYPRIGHTYRLLYASIDRALEWNAGLLVDMLPRLDPAETKAQWSPAAADTPHP
ncbi:MAG: hypothetical protein AAFS10_03570 [Myxococcota bacterium]